MEKATHVRNMQISTNPANGETFKTYPLHSEEAVRHAINEAHDTFLRWRATPLEERKKRILKVQATLLAGKETHARTISMEMGKPLKEAISEIEKCASAAQFFAENSAAFLADKEIPTEHVKSYVSFQPLGVILGIMPWNFPYWQVLRYALPALMAGNTCLLKHASNTPGCAMGIETLFRESGLPAGCFQSLIIPSSRMEAVIADPKIAAVTLTGSTPAGSSVAALSGKYLKKTVLELGGSDAYLILADADIDHAVKLIGNGRLVNCGQSCVSPKRLVVHESVKEKFEQGLLALFQGIKIGDPLEEGTNMGPMSRADLRDELHQQVQRSVDAGAKLLTGGKIPDRVGAFYPPTILTDVKKGMAAYDEEMFGPVAVIISARSDEEAVAIANDTVFGLGGAIFTQDRERGERIAREQIQSGSCFVNGVLRSDPRLPFGGIKQSGYGRELSAFGQHEFVNIKTIVVD